MLTFFADVVVIFLQKLHLSFLQMSNSPFCRHHTHHFFRCCTHLFNISHSPFLQMSHSPFSRCHTHLFADVTLTLSQMSHSPFCRCRTQTLHGGRPHAWLGMAGRRRSCHTLCRGTELRQHRQWSSLHTCALAGLPRWRRQCGRGCTGTFHSSGRGSPAPSGCRTSSCIWSQMISWICDVMWQWCKVLQGIMWHCMWQHQLWQFRVTRLALI